MDKVKLGTIGDINPIEYGGGIVYKEYDSLCLEFTHGIEEDEKTATVYRIPIEEDIFDDLCWVDLEDVASCCGYEVEEIEAFGRDKDPVVRAQVLADIGGYYGFHELDYYPLVLSVDDLETRWEE